MTADDLFGLAGKCAMVIGGGQGMGESTAVLLARAGCNVAVVDVEEGRAEHVAKLVRKLGRHAVTVTANVLDIDLANSIVARAEEGLGGLDVMISIVGETSWYGFLDMTPAQWDLDQLRNLRYFTFCAQAVARALVRNGKPGSITAISSVSGIQSGPRHAGYAAAKAGLINLVKSMAVELAPHRIRVNSIAPGTIKTPRIAAMPNVDEFDATVQRSLVPYGVSGTPDDVGKAALFMSSDLASYVTGQTLAVDGGWTAAWLLGSNLR
jgi:3-oxoacyl-[acyl-carrier protein] reductase